MNYLALNLTHDIVQGEKSIEDARSFYAETVVAFMKGEKPEYTQRLLYSANNKSGDRDQTVIDKKVIKELMGKDN